MKRFNSSCRAVLSTKFPQIRPQPADSTYTISTLCNLKIDMLNTNLYKNRLIYINYPNLTLSYILNSKLFYVVTFLLSFIYIKNARVRSLLVEIYLSTIHLYIYNNELENGPFWFLLTRTTKSKLIKFNSSLK